MCYTPPPVGGELQQGGLVVKQEPRAFQFNCIMSVPVKVSLHESARVCPLQGRRSRLPLTSEPQRAHRAAASNKPPVLLRVCRAQRSAALWLLLN